MSDCRKEAVLLVAAPGGSDVLGGGERLLPDLISYLLGRMWKITLACPQDSALLKVLDLPVNLAVEKIDLGQTGLGVANVSSKVAKLACKHKKAVFFGNSYRSLKWLAVAKTAASVPTVCYLQESEYSQYHSLKARMTSRFVDKVIAISQAVQQEFQSATNLPAEKFLCIPHGVPILIPDKSQAIRKAFWEQHGVAGEEKIICMVGRTDPLKGHEILAEAFARLTETKSHVNLVVVGLQSTSSEEKRVYDRFMAKVKQFDLSSKVKVLPNLPNAREFMRHSDLLVVPSISEGLGRVAIEGQAEQTCVVASAVGGLKEIVSDGVTGSLVPSGDAEALMRAFAKLLDNDRLREELAKSGWENAHARFSVQVMNKAFEEVWLQLLNSRQEV